MKKAFAAFLLAGLCGCVPAPRFHDDPATRPSPTAHPPAPANFPVHIAVLPINNGTQSADGALIVRALAMRAIGYELGFVVPRTDEVDNALGGRDLVWSGHPDGHQPLSKQDPAIVAAWLGVDGVLWGNLGSYSKESISLYSESKVNVHFWLTDSKGKKIWDGRQESGGSGLSQGGGSLEMILSDGSMPPDIQDKIRHSNVADTAYEAVEGAFLTFPRR